MKDIRKHLEISEIEAIFPSTITGSDSDPTPRAGPPDHKLGVNTPECEAPAIMTLSDRRAQQYVN
ncbi:hypothetical protein E2C01_041302 [Portunus trituberculatus]|uniref:Uncharacterized protein n=1 Tax=Portunus trituberculatus TaxID=210409 RepID=A0A5B7FM88_PORTR|nr:hypothetical protein [Portunus trituberculatus]